MDIAIKKEYDINRDTFHLMLMIDYDNESREVRELIHERRYTFLSETLRTNFNTHRDLYKLISPRFLSDKYNPSGNYFEPQTDTGYKHFIEDINPRQLERFTNIYSSIILGGINEVQQRLDSEYTAHAALPFIDFKDKMVGVEEVSIEGTPLIITRDKTYQLELREVEPNGMKAIEQRVYAAIKEDFESQIRSVQEVSKQRIKELKNRLEQEKGELIVEFLTNSKDILQNWEFVDYEGALFLKYKERITVDKIVYDGYTYNYPSNLEGMYVSGLKVRVTPLISASDVIITRGNHLHFNGSTGCIGNLDGKDLLYVLKHIPEALKIANMDSPLNDILDNMLTDNFLETVTREDGVKMEWEL